MPAKNPLIVSKLPNPIHSGDWHDAPLRWTVTGEGYQTQHFRTRGDAERWKKAYFKTDFATAMRTFIGN